MKLLNEYITESFNKEYGYRIKFAADCGAEHMAKVESCLAKYNLVSATPFKRTPIEENPIEFVRYKGVQCTSEVCSSDIILKYPVNERILEVWLAVNLGLDHSRVLCYGVNDPRRIESDMAAERKVRDDGRVVNEDEAELAQENFDHYENKNAEIEDFDLFGEAYNTKFLAELEKIKAEKGADYFTNYPTKSQLMGDDLRQMHDDMMNQPNMGRTGEQSKEVDVISQSGGGKV
jgi:hypothetical protein